MVDWYSSTPLSCPSIEGSSLASPGTEALSVPASSLACPGTKSLSVPPSSLASPGTGEIIYEHSRPAGPHIKTIEKLSSIYFAFINED